jgi:hypothetical protein
MGGFQSRYGHGAEEKNSQPPPVIEPRSSACPARSQLLYRLSCPGSYVLLYEVNLIRALQFATISSLIGYYNIFLFHLMTFP